MVVRSRKARNLVWILLALTAASAVATTCRAEIAYVGAFGSGLAIYVVDESALTTHLLTTGPIDTSPAWSPDGKRVAFARWVGDAPDIFIVDSDGTHLQRLTDNPGQDFAPVWSPDGSEIAFLREQDGVTAPYVMDPDGQNQRRFPGLPDNIASLDWSPDGRQVVFDRVVDYQYRLSIMAIATGEIRELEGVSGSEPAWSPDGSWIAFSGDLHVGLIHSDGTGLKWITTQGGRNVHPSWSPDSSRVAYQSDDLGRDTICVVSLATGTYFRIADIGTSPDWSPKR